MFYHRAINRCKIALAKPRKRSYIPSPIKFSRKITRKFNALQLFCYSLGHGWFFDAYFYHRPGWSNNTPSLGLHYVSVVSNTRNCNCGWIYWLFPMILSILTRIYISVRIFWKHRFYFVQKFVIALHMSVSRLSMHLVYVHVATYTKKYSTFIQTYSAKWSRIR